MFANDGSMTHKTKGKQKGDFLGRLEYNMIGQSVPFLWKMEILRQFIFRPLLGNYIGRTIGI